MRDSIQSHAHDGLAHQPQEETDPPRLGAPDEGKGSQDEIDNKAQQLPTLPLERGPEIGFTHDEECAKSPDENATCQGPIHRYRAHLLTFAAISVLHIRLRGQLSSIRSTRTSVKAVRERFPGWVVLCSRGNCGQRRSKVSWLRGPDSNRQPPGYEPDELPVAPPRTFLSIISVREEARN